MKKPSVFNLVQLLSSEIKRKRYKQSYNQKKILFAALCDNPIIHM